MQAMSNGAESLEMAKTAALKFYYYLVFSADSNKATGVQSPAVTLPNH